MSNLKNKFIPKISNDQECQIEAELNQDFGALLDTFSNNIKENTVVKGQVVDVTNAAVVIDVGLKNEGRVPKEEFTFYNDQELPKVGDIVEVYVESIDGGHNGKTILSRTKAIREDSWKKLEIAHEKGEIIHGVIFGRVKGGFTVDLCGVIGFLPGSQVDIRPIKDITPLMNISQPFQILKMDHVLGNIVVSRKAILDESVAGERDKILSTIQEGMILDGVVKNITDYGAFIDLGNIDGLLHVTDISWNRVNHPSEILALGQTLKVIVIKFNQETKRISLGLKQLDENPWKDIKDQFQIGQKMKGRVTNVADYGIFIELKDGIEGLVHSSEISWVKSEQNPRKFITIGQEIEFIILDIDTEKHRISLSIKQCQGNPFIKFAQEHPVGSIINAPVRNITDFAIFIAIDANIDGMIHETDIYWDKRGMDALSEFKKLDDIQCKVLAIDVEKERISLGVKQLTESPYKNLETLKNGMVVTCTVKELKNDGIVVVFNEGIEGFIKKYDLSSEKSDQRIDRFAPNDRVDAKIIAVDLQSNKVTLSIKALEMIERAKAIKEYGSTDSGASLGDILGEALGSSNDVSNNKKM